MRMMRFVFALISCAPLVAAAQTGTVTGVVVGAESQVALSFSAVRINDGAALLATDSGRFKFTGVAAGAARLHVQHIGYFPRDIEVDVRANEVIDVRVQLVHVPVRLATLHVTDRACLHPGRPNSGDSTLNNIFQQLTLNAEQYRLFNTSYPSAAIFVRRFSRQYQLNRMEPGGAPDSFDIVSRADAIEIKSESEWHYKPGEVIKRDPTARGILPSFGVAIPSLAVFSDPQFVSSHCFWDGGEVTTAGVKERRIDFTAARSIDDPDLDGSLFLDPATFLIRRSIISLSKKSRVIPSYDSVSVETRFSEIAPGVAVIISTRGRSTLAADVALDRAPPPVRACLRLMQDLESQHLATLDLPESIPTALRIGAADALATSSSGPPSARRLVRVVTGKDEPVSGAQVRDSLTGTMLYTGEEGLMDLAWFGAADTLTLHIERPQFLSGRIRIPMGAGDSTSFTVHLDKGISPFSDTRRPFLTCR